MSFRRIQIVFSLTLVVSLMSACAGKSAPSDAQRAQPQVTDKSRAAPESEHELPQVRLTGPILRDILLGEIAGRQGRYAVSVAALTRAAVATRDPRIAERATQVALYVKHYAAAVKVGTLWVELQPDNGLARQSLAAALLARGKTVRARTHFAKLLEIAASNKDLDKTYLRIAAALERQQDRKAAFRVMQQLARQYPRNAFAQYGVANLALRIKNMSAATAAVDRALLLLPESEDIALLKARILMSAGKPKLTDNFYAGYLRRYPQSQRLRLQYARSLVDRQQWRAASVQFKVILKARPDDREVLYTLGLLGLQSGNLDEARDYLGRVIKRSPGDHQARLFMGQVAERQKRYKDAERWYRDIRGSRFDFEARVRLSVLVARRNKLKEARRILRAVQPKTDAQRVQVVLAEEQMLREAKQYNEALKVLSRALRRMPKHTDILYARALVAEKLDNIAMAERDLRLVLRLDPKNAHALNALGYTLADRTGRHKEAFRLIRRALALKPNDPFILDSMGWVHYRMGKLKDAEAYLRRALKIRWDAEISAHLGEVLWVKGDRQAARRVWRTAMKRAPKNEALKKIVKKFKP